MNFVGHLIKNLRIRLSPSWSKNVGGDETKVKVKAKHVAGDVAGRDINKTYVSEAVKKEESPYVYITGAFGGNGHVLHFSTFEVHNLSDQFIFVEQVEVLGEAIPTQDRLVKAGESIRHAGRNDLSYPTSDKNQYVETTFHTRDGKRFATRQALQLRSRVADDKFDITGMSQATMERLPHEE